MVRKNEIGKQNPFLGMSILDILNKMFPDPKYVSLFVNLMKNKIKTTSYFSNIFSERQEKIGQLTSINAGGVSTIELGIILEIYSLDNLPQLDNFITLYERNLILKRDLTEYSSFGDIQDQVNVATLRAITKDMEKEVNKIYENDEWLALIPLSYESSLKYGANTKWCTASAEHPIHFYNHVRTGCLIYCINKVRGKKVAAFYNRGENDLGFWDATDRRIDSCMLGIPNEVMNVILHYFIDDYKTNVQHMNEEQYEKFVEIEKSMISKDINLVIEEPYPALQMENQRIN